MEQVQGGDLIVNKGADTKPKGDSGDTKQPKLDLLEGQEAAFKLAQVKRYKFTPL
jgi:hypothetical protein